MFFNVFHVCFSCDFVSTTHKTTEPPFILEIGQKIER